MVMVDDISQQSASDSDFEEVLWRFLDGASPKWTKLDLPDETAAQSGAFLRLVLSGQVQLKLSVLALGLAEEPEVQATVIVTGDYTKILAGEIRSAVPEFSGRVLVTPQWPAEYRLTRAGADTQREIRQFGGGQFEEGFLSATLQFTIPGAVGIQSMRYIRTVPAAPKPADAPAAPADKRQPRTPAWPAAKTESHVAAFLAARKDIYVKMAGDLLDDMPVAHEKFRNIFGSTAIAREITMKVGDSAPRACCKKDVDKTHTYKKRIQPLLRTPPRRPDDWDELIAGRHGRDESDLVDEIPFEEDDP